jgi:NADH-quinone oxidoreductase subunit J
MIIQGLTFYMFSLVAIASALLVVTSRNPVHSVLFLILAFFNVAGLFVLLGAEFLAMILVIVYVGAVAVLFMFVVMMLDINFVELRQGFLQYLPYGIVIGLVLLAELVIVMSGWQLSPESLNAIAAPIPETVTNTHALGAIIYTDYIYSFQVAGFILLIAMIGAIVLTHRKRPGVRKQKIANQLARKPEDSLKIHKVQSGKGI